MSDSHIYLEVDSDAVGYELYCPLCYRRIYINLETGEMIILVDGDQMASHLFMTGGIRIEVPSVNQPDDWDRLLDEMDFEELWR